MTAFLSAVVACVLLALTGGMVMKAYQKDSAEGYSTVNVRQSEEAATQNSDLKGM